MTNETTTGDHRAWDIIPDDAAIERTRTALQANNMRARIVGSGEQARRDVMAMLPDGATVMNVTSATLDQLGLSKEIEEATRFDSIRKRIIALPQSEQRAQMRRLTAAADVAVGSVHAITEDGQILVASNSGSQLALYVFSAARVIWVVGAQKIVADVEQGMARIREHSFKLEDERMRKVYGMGSAINKILLVNREVFPDRVDVILVKEILGF